MDKLEKEYIELLSPDRNAGEKFWELKKRIKTDKKKVGVVADMRRSKLMENILSLVLEGAIEIEDLDEFSDDLKDTIRSICRKY
jgi:hypothetical protein